MFFARGSSPGQKWWRTLLGREISCSQWEGPSMHSSCLAFFPFKFRGEGVMGKIFFFHFSLVPTMFPSSSQQVPNVLPNMFFIAPHFYPICVGKCCPPFTYIAVPKGRNIICQNRTFYLESLHSFIFWVMGESYQLIARKIKIELGRHII